MTWRHVAVSTSTIYLIDAEGRCWTVDAYEIADRTRWKEVVHPLDLEPDAPSGERA